MQDNITLSIPPEKHKFLNKTIESLKSGIRMLGINPLYKKSLLEDVHKVESILKSNRKGQ